MESTQSKVVLELFANKEEVESLTLTKEHLDKIYQLGIECYSAFINYLTNIAIENVQTKTEKPLDSFSDEEKDELLVEGIKDHFRDMVSKSIAANGNIDALAIVSYFDDYAKYLNTAIEEPFASKQELIDLHLESYVKEAVSSIHGSTLDVFWLSRFEHFTDFEEAIDANINLCIDFTHVYFDQLAERFMAIYSRERIARKLEEPTEAEIETIVNFIIDQYFDDILAEVSNSSINDYCNLLIDPINRVMMKLMRYLEEVAYSYLSDQDDPLWKIIDSLRVEQGAAPGALYDLVIDEFIEIVRRNQDIDSFTMDELEMLKVPSSFKEAQAEAYDLVSAYSEVHSGMEPEERVVNIHARYMVLHDIFKTFMKMVCDATEAMAMQRMWEVEKIEGESQAEYRERQLAHLATQDVDIYTYAIIEASHDIWEQMYPDKRLELNIEGDEEGDYGVSEE